MLYFEFYIMLDKPNYKWIGLYEETFYCLCLETVTVEQLLIDVRKISVEYETN